MPSDDGTLGSRDGDFEHGLCDIHGDRLGLGGRQLQTLDPRRMPLHEWRKAADDLKEFGQELTLPVSKLIASSSELAVDQALMLYERFHWEPDRASVNEEQRKLLERRY